MLEQLTRPRRDAGAYTYRYEMHCHCNWCSACAHSSPQAMAQACYQAGYAGMVLTDHFLSGSTAIDRSLPWKDKVEAYWRAYEAARDWAQGRSRDFTVLFGLEHQYGGGKEVLTYGIDLDFLLAHPDLDQYSLADYTDAVRRAGGLISMAHPYRHAGYIDDTILPQPQYLDGAEVYNYGNTPEENRQAYELAREHRLIPTSGGDVHREDEENLAKAGIALASPIATGEELVQVLRSLDYRIIADGQVR